MNPPPSAPVGGAVTSAARSILRALSTILVVVWGAATAGFAALRLIPGDPVDIMLGVQARVSDSVREQIRSDWGMDEPVLVQYFLYMSRLVRADLGQSYQLRSPVIDVMGQQTIPTLQLTALAMVFAVVLALGTALLARGPRATRIVSVCELVAVSSPTFWIGLVLLAVFSFQLGWFPVSGTVGFSSIFLPAVTLALPVSGILSQVLRQGLDAAENQPFATTARSRGVTRAGLVIRHSLRHAAAGSVTLTGYLAGSLLGGAVLVETVFARPGLGGVAIRAIISRDIPVVLGIIVLAAVVFAVVNLLVDLSYRALDPRLRLSLGATAT
jgi:peptide/nickel transport system permease protein